MSRDSLYIATFLVTYDSYYRHDARINGSKKQSFSWLCSFFVFGRGWFACSCLVLDLSFRYRCLTMTILSQFNDTIVMTRAAGFFSCIAAVRDMVGQLLEF